MLPLGRLVAADVVLAVATLVGLALFVVPGVVIFTLWSLVGPVITIEDRSVGSALRRSWQLVRPCFWLTLFLVTLPLQVEQAVLHAIHYTDIFEHPLVPAFLLNGLLGMVDRLRRRTRRGRPRLRTDRPHRTFASAQFGAARSGDDAIGTDTLVAGVRGDAEELDAALGGFDVSVVVEILEHEHQVSLDDRVGAIEGPLTLGSDGVNDASAVGRIDAASEVPLVDERVDESGRRSVS